MIFARIVDDTLLVSLPADLRVAGREALVEAVERTLAPGVRRVRIDAAALESVDTAGLGALARIMRLAVDATGAPPRLVNPSPELRDELRSVLLLGFFDEFEGE